MNKKLEELEIIKLAHAEWNPRTPEELDWDHPEMAKLIASVRSVGIAQPIAVWGDAPDMPDDCALVIAGNRRLEAASAAGLKKIPALVFTGLTEAQAREITRIENEVRLGISPLKDAELIGSMLALNYNQKEIAAHFGVSEATICRRAKLLNLAAEIRELVINGKNVATDALERIALYPRETQMTCVKIIQQDRTDFRWRDFHWNLARYEHDLDAGQFPTDDCVGCLSRTGAMGDLWGDIPDDGKLGRCLMGDCYTRKCQREILRDVQSRVGDGVEIVDGLKSTNLCSWEVPGDERFSNRRSKKRPAAWFWNNGDGTHDNEIHYGPSLADFLAERERRAAEAAQRKLEREEQEKQQSEKNKEYSRLNRELDDYRRAIDDACCGNLQEFTRGGNALKNSYQFFKFAEPDEARIKLIMKLLSDCIEWYFDDYTIEEKLLFFKAFPKFQELCGVTDKMLNDYQAALEAFENFGREEEK